MDEKMAHSFDDHHKKEAQAPKPALPTGPSAEKRRPTATGWGNVRSSMAGLTVWLHKVRREEAALRSVSRTFL